MSASGSGNGEKKLSIKEEIANLVAAYGEREREAESFVQTSVGTSTQNAIAHALHAGSRELEFLNAAYALAKKTASFTFTVFLPKDQQAKADEATTRFQITKRSLDRFVRKTKAALVSQCDLVRLAGSSEEGKRYAREAYAIVGILKDARVRYEPRLGRDSLLANAEDDWKSIVRNSMHAWPEPERIGDTSILGGGTARQNAAEGEPLPTSVSEIRRPNKP